MEHCDDTAMEHCDDKNSGASLRPRRVLSAQPQLFVRDLQVGYLEQRWAQLESLIQGKIQASAHTLEELARVEAQLREAREWVEEQRPALTSALKTSPPPLLSPSQTRCCSRSRIDLDLTKRPSFP